MERTRFRDRKESGLLLGERLRRYARDPKAIVIGMPRGGVVTGYALAALLDLPLDVLPSSGEDPRFHRDRPPAALGGRTVIVVDHGVMSPSAMLAAIQSIRAQSPARIVIAVPVAARRTCEQLRKLSDEFFCLATPEVVANLAEWYDDFTPVSDSEVVTLIQKACIQPVAR